jgi:hypothetical protein
MIEEWKKHRKFTSELFTFEALKQRVPLIIEIVNSNIQALKDDSKFIEKNGLYSFTEKISGVGMINIIIGSGGSHIFWLMSTNFCLLMHGKLSAKLTL